MSKPFLSILPVFLAASLTPALAQQQTAFTLRIQQGQNSFQVANGQTLSFSATAVGQASTLTLTGTYAGTTTAVISSQPQILGNPEFTIGSIGNTPLTLAPGATFKLDITYKPTTGSSSVAQLVINFAQTSATAGQPSVNGNITLNLTGVAPNFSVNYVLPPSNNVTPILDGGTVTFPPTLINTTNSATIVIANTGTGPSTINSVTVSGTAFQLQGLGLLPAAISAGGTGSFVVKYTPVNPGADTGTLTLGFPGQTFTINLTGSATSSIVSYQEITGQTVTPLTAGQQITLPDTSVGVPSSVAIQVQNTGTASATINSVSFSGVGFTLTNVPILPIALVSGGSFTFNLNFTPTQVGPATGTLTIGPDRFLLSSNGIGAQLTYSYTGSSGATVTVQPPQGTVLFSSVPLAQSSSTAFTVTNTGSSAATITNVGIVGSAGFTLSLPPLPVTLAPGASYSFTVKFSPLVQGLNTANLLINGQSFVLSAFGTSVPTLPQFQITGLSGQLQPFTQPALGVTLAQPYPLDVNGTLTMGVSSTVFATDPSVQFATGGRSVSFTIPAGATQATFLNGSTQLQLQTGTVAETINIGASFATAGGVTVTSPNTAPLVVNVPRSAPTLISVAQQNFTTSGFTILVTGYSTTRTLSKVNLQFTGAPGLTLSGASFTVDVTQAATFWFSGSTSQPFGGLFAISIPVNVKVTGGTAPTTLSGQFTVTATATNDVGTSNSVTQ
ncbi:MAG: hypothetical protein JWO80_3396 [Bryobacterales bacterium]|nr:hypothetical protein [Bryobacterales bacterium]